MIGYPWFALALSHSTLDSIDPFRMNYKDTLHLPKTDFPMKADLVSREPVRLKRWEAEDVYAQIQEARKGAPALRAARRPALCQRRCPHRHRAEQDAQGHDRQIENDGGFSRAVSCRAGTATACRSSSRWSRNRADYRRWRCARKRRLYARKFIDVQRAQFKRLGVSAIGTIRISRSRRTTRRDHARLRHVVEKGLVYQCKKPVYWSTGRQTALAEAEVEYRPHSPAIYVKFAVTPGTRGQGDMVIWTTTPWTLPANLGITLHPDFKYSARPWRDPKSGAVETLVVADGLAEAVSRETGWEAAARRSGDFRAGTSRTRRLAHPFLHRVSL